MNDLVKNAKILSQLTFQVDVPFGVEKKQYFCMRADTISINGRDCKMIQLMDISQTVQYDDVV